jgi:hypothetical protein
MKRAALVAALFFPALASAGEAPDEWAHWHWVYQGIAHAQRFEATGTEVKSLMVRVARMLPDRAPSSPLIVEVRDLSLQKTLVRGSLPPAEAGKDLRWVEVPLAKGAGKLEKGKTYVVVLRSADTLNEAPWIVAAKDEQVPKGVQADLAKRQLATIVLFRDGADVRFGPQVGAPETTPTGKRTNGGQPYGKSIVVELDLPLPESVLAPSPPKK